MKKVINRSFIFIAFLIISGCLKDKTPLPPTIGCDPTHVYFENDVKPILNSNCAKSGCHDPITHEEGYDYSTYAGAFSSVKPGNPNGSKLYKVITETDPDDMMPPPGNAPLSQTQIDIIRKWIAQGGANDGCIQDSGSCNSQNMSFAKDISVIIANNCNGCHSGASPSGGIDLTTYSSVASNVATGKLYNSVAQNGLAKPMPESSKLSKCDIDKIKSWIDAGYPNN